MMSNGNSEANQQKATGNKTLKRIKKLQKRLGKESIFETVKMDKIQERTENKIRIDNYGDKLAWHKYKNGKWFANQTIDYEAIRQEQNNILTYFLI